MARSILYGVTESLESKLTSPVFKEASQVLGVYDNLKELKKTLLSWWGVLYSEETLLSLWGVLYSKESQEQNNELREWLRQIKRVLHDAQDLLDEFECEALRKLVVKPHGTTKSKVSHFFSSYNPLGFRYRITRQIKDVIKRLDNAAADMRDLQMIHGDIRVVYRREETSSHVVGSNVIGRERDKERIIELLMQQNPNDDDTKLSVIPIVGMGGLGKTTLAKVVFNDETICRCFDLRLWVCVSNDFDIRKLVIKIICSVSGDEQRLNQLGLEQLQNQFTIEIGNKRLLLVLDDVWDEVYVRWIDLKHILELGALGCTILVTTRSHTIASKMGTVPFYILESLSQKHSLYLFVKGIFREGEKEKYPHLMNIGREIVDKCGGVPLSVITIMRILFREFEANKWEYVRDNEIWKFPDDIHKFGKFEDIFHALKLSYDRMPSYLQRCFALFSLYPKDYIFHSFEISSLWGALGLLDSPNKNLEDVANKYLYELQSSSFLHDFVNLGSASSFKIHDLVHDLACFVAKEECLFVNSHNQNIPDSVLHLSFAENTFLDKLLTTKSVHLRTILFPYVTVEANDETLLDTCVSKFKFLRILDLSSLACETLPRHIGKLKHLRYISIRSNHNIKRLPDSICELHNLQVLKLDGCIELEELPKGLRKLTSLRLLEITTKQFVLPDNDIANLSSLTFLCIASSHNLESIFKGVKFPSLKSLSVFDCQRLKYLQIDVQIFPELETFIVEGCPNLDLQMWRDHHEEQSSKLKLTYVHFSNLPQLVTLPQWLQETVHSLQTLVIKKCENLEMFPEWLLTLANLKTLAIINCPKLLSLPANIHNLTSLENLRIHDCPKLCRKYEAYVGEFWHKISHIKDVVIGDP